MTDQAQPQDNSPQQPDAPPPQPPAEAQTTSSGDDNRVPYQRFKTVLDENNSLKTRLEALEEAEADRKAAEMSELEKANAKASEAEAKLQDLNHQFEQERKARLEDRRDNALAQSLASAGAIDADELVVVLKAKQSTDVDALMAADGTLDSDAIRALVDKTKAERAHNFQSSGVGSPSNRGGQIPAPESEDAQRLAAKAAQFGYDLDPRKLAERMLNNPDE